MFSTADTIVALATPRGHGGIGLVRLSGADAHRIVLRLIDRRTPLAPRRATLARIVDEAGVRTLDRVVTTLFERPRSFTGEDVVEVTGHGSPVLLDAIVRRAMDHGARLAEPGEFTLRAYLNGKLDLVQAEAIADLVDAVTPLQARAAMDQLEGTLTDSIARIDARLFDLTARLEASLDFPDEGFHFITRDEAVREVGAIRRDLEALVRTGRSGRVLREGRTVVIAGAPNAGKSTLFNTLVGSERAIVTEIAGTTRDLLTERVDIGGLAITLVDTAGLRDASEGIEAEGVRRAHDARAVADLTIFVVDGSVPMDRAVRHLIRHASGPMLVVLSKHDLPRVWDPIELGDVARNTIDVSVPVGHGLDGLRRAIVAALTSGEEWRDAPAVSNLRHLAHLEDALAVVGRAEEELGAGATEELVLAELAAARESLEAVTGRRAPEELVRHIFSRFCVGK